MKYIYCFTNQVNGKQYVGSTINLPARRKAQHIYNAFHQNVGDKYYYPLSCAIRKYGIQNFDFQILYQGECSEEELRKLEYDFIIKMDVLCPHGYNQTLDTEHPINDPLVYKKISETKRENAKQVAEIDTNNKILAIYRSIKDCAEYTSLSERHIASCCRGERRSTQKRYFCWINEDGSLNVPKYTGPLYKGKPGSTQIQSTSKKVQKIDISTGEILQTYDTIALAARENNCDASGISKVCRGIRNKSGGYKWQYE